MPKNQPTAHLNVDGTPDMRFKENRDDPDKVQEANERRSPDALPGGGLTKTGKPDMRLKQNRDGLTPEGAVEEEEDEGEVYIRRKQAA